MREETISLGFTQLRTPISMITTLWHPDQATSSYIDTCFAMKSYIFHKVTQLHFTI